MCARYKLEDRWLEYCNNPSFDWDNLPYPPYPAIDLSANDGEVFPRTLMPIVRRNQNAKLVVDLRRWGYIILVNGKTLDAEGRPKKVRRDVYNAMSEKLLTSYAWKFSFQERRCLIPMSSWDEWPETGAGKQRVRVSMPREPVFMAAGLYDVSTDPKTGEKVPVYTMCTVPPNEFLGTVHDRAPMVLLPSQYAAWLGGGDAALGLVGTHPDAGAFIVNLA
jgi:putative SOS response-associated peptidase YedK